jgi:hypothetical protein
MLLYGMVRLYNSILQENFLSVNSAFKEITKEWERCLTIAFKSEYQMEIVQHIKDSNHREMIQPIIQ